MAAVRLPDGRELDVGTRREGADVAERIGKRLARDAVVAMLNGELIDLDASLNGGGDFEVVTKNSPDGLEVIRHSTAHAMAQAILELYPGSKLTIGPPIENGFFYDIEVDGKISDEDLPRIEEKMREVVARDLPVEREEVSKAEAEELYATIRTSWRSSATSRTAILRCTVRAIFRPLPRPARAEHRLVLGAFKLQNIAGGVLARGREEPDAHPRLRHRLGFGEGAQGLPATAGGSEGPRPPQDRPGPAPVHVLARTWARASRCSCPRARCCGTSWRGSCARCRRVTATITCGPATWSTRSSTRDRAPGALQRRDVPADGGRETRYRLKPMNCPSHMTLFNTEAHSYRELPIRYAEFSTLYPLREERGANGPHAGARPHAG
jgi:threonyl-tRNA synthetase